MAITRVSKLLSVGVTLALLTPHVLGQGGGGGGGPPGGSTSGSTSATSTTLPPPDATTTMSDTTSATSTNPPPPDATTTTSDTTSATSTLPPPPDATTTMSDSTSATSTTPPAPESTTTTSDSTSATSTLPPPPDATTSASGSTSTSTITATISGSSDTSRGLPPDTSGDGTPPPLGGSDDESLPPPDASGSSSGPPDQGGPGGSSTDEIYFPSMYTEECNHLGEDAHYAIKITDGVRQAWSDTGCSNHVNWGVDKGPDYHFPGRVTPSNTSIPAYPMLIGGNGTTDLSTTNGQVAILVNGVAMFSAWATEPVTDYNSTAFALEGDTLDACGGHATTEGWYHYHGTPGCLEEQVMKGEGLTLDDHSPFLGWSYDGFPMYGHLGPGGVEMKACGTNSADDTYCLDTCSGYEGEVEGIDEFKYRYYLTCGYDDSFFPMTINCFRGCCPVDMECADVVEVCDDTADDGYTVDYVVTEGYNYTSMYELEVLSGDDSEYINSSTGPNCTMFYDETLSYTVEQINIEAFPNGTTPSPSSSDRSVGDTETPTSSATAVSGAPTTPSPTTADRSVGDTETPTSSATAVSGAPTTPSPTTADGMVGVTGAPMTPAPVVGGAATTSAPTTADTSGAFDRSISSRALFFLAGTPAVAAIVGALEWIA